MAKSALRSGLLPPLCVRREIEGSRLHHWLPRPCWVPISSVGRGSRPLPCALCVFALHTNTAEGRAHHSNELFITAFLANFREYLFRNCLENRTRSRIGTPKVTRRGQWDPDQPLPGADEARPRGPRLFSKQFLRAFGWIGSRRVPNNGCIGACAWVRTALTCDGVRKRQLGADNRGLGTTQDATIGRKRA